MKYKNKNKKNVTIIFLIIVSIALVILVFEKTGVTNIYQQPQASTQDTTSSFINLAPPTEEESAAGNAKKESIISNENSGSGQQQLPTTAEVIITDATQYDSKVEVRAFVSNVIESGTCSFVFKKGTQLITKSMPANADASSTPCMTLIMDRSEFSQTGTWNLVVSYSNSSITGQSTTTIEVK